MSALKKFWKWTKKNVGNVLVGAGTILSVALPPVGAVVLGAGGAIQAIKANREKGSIDTVVTYSNNTIDRLKGNIHVNSYYPDQEPDLVAPGMGAGMLAGINPLYLGAAGLFLAFLLFKK